MSGIELISFYSVRLFQIELKESHQIYGDLLIGTDIRCHFSQRSLHLFIPWMKALIPFTRKLLRVFYTNLLYIFPTWKYIYIYIFSTFLMWLISHWFFIFNKIFLSTSRERSLNASLSAHNWSKNRGAEYFPTFFLYLKNVVAYFWNIYLRENSEAMTWWANFSALLLRFLPFHNADKLSS